MRKIQRILLFTLAMVVSLSVTTDMTQAQERDPNFWSNNDILYYDPTYQSTCSAGSGMLRGANTKEKIWNFLIGNEFTPEQAAGLMANMQKESNFIPVRYQGDNNFDPRAEGGGKGWGLVQWDSGRRQNIFKTIDKDKPHLAPYTAFQYNGIKEPNAEFPAKEFDELLLFELDYMMQESIDRNVTADHFPGGAGKEWARMKEQPTLRDATLFWERNFEVSGDINHPERLEQRVDYAEAIFAEFKDNLSAEGSGTAGCTGASGIQELVRAYAWPEYHAPSFTQAQPAYAEAVQKAQDEGRYVGGWSSSGNYPGIDCGGFVTLLITNSGHDPKYNHSGKGGNTSTQIAWLRDESNGWRRLGRGGDFSSADLRAGDVAIYSDGDSGHTYVYVGEEMATPNPPDPPFGGNGSTPGVASASIGSTWRAPMAGRESLDNPTFEWFTKD